MLDDRLPTVLVVDDEAAIRDWLRVSLALRGWVVTTVATGAEGLAELESSTPDLVVVDYEMPGLTGIEFAAELRGRGLIEPIILFSAFIDAERTEQARALDVQPMSKVDQQSFFRMIDALHEQLVTPAAV
jgi:CheY-like chemotaxis protein